ncbi:type 1 glutamine amidotransferase [Chitinibacter tainanensis]|uniref:type 1 glutamine amidotransferase n=1 Tax=Chitinibacter tainanensis TaxID=230667 RepID=UPI000402F482|nr:type 1 glutamine amidotransferase [Chitinibacter tainanensis]
MRPIAICQHERNQGPGFLQQYLDRYALPYRIFAIDEGDTPPSKAAEFSGIVLLGSNASANDGYSWLRREDQLLQDALARQCPILGHCFGGQMLARALGASVRRNSVPQIGWGKVLLTRFSEAHHWLGPQREIEIFHWHFETFAIPRGAKRVLFGTHCMNKGFAYGPHLALQSHLEVTAESIAAWCEEGAEQIRTYQHLPSVQSWTEMQFKLDEKVARLHRVAEHCYRSWLTQVAGCPPESQLSHATLTARPRGGESFGSWLAREAAPLRATQ